MAIQSDQYRHQNASGQLTLFRRRDNRAPNFRVELRALKPAYGLVCRDQCPLLALSGNAWVRCTCLLLTQSGHV